MNREIFTEHFIKNGETKFKQFFSLVLNCCSVFKNYIYKTIKINI